MFSFSSVITLLSAWVVLSVPISLIAGHFLSSQEKRASMAYFPTQSKNKTF